MLSVINIWWLHLYTIYKFDSFITSINNYVLNNTSIVLSKAAILDILGTKYPGSEWIHVYSDGSAFTQAAVSGAILPKGNSRVMFQLEN